MTRTIRFARHRAVMAGSALLLTGCFGLLSSKGGGEVSREAAAKPRRVAAPDISVPPGYRIDAIARGLTFPTGVAFGDRGEIYVIESGYAYGEVFTTPRLIEITRDRRERVVASGDHAPWTGVAYHGGAFFIAQGGAIDGGRIVRIDRNGKLDVLVDHLPSVGDHHTNGPAVSRDGWVYFGQGTATNSAVVGLDNAGFGWLARQPKFHDIPCRDVRLRGVNFTSANPLTRDEDDEVTTGAYLPFGAPSEAGQVVPGRLPCNGAVMRVRASGGDLELVAWGFRNPFGLAFAADGTLYVTDNGADVRGSRPIFGSADALWRVETGRWYGWPDYSEGRPLTMDFYGESDGDPKGFVLAEHPGQPPEPVAYLPVHSSANGFDFSRNPAFGHVGSAFMALFGDMAPAVGKVLAPVGFSVVRVDPRTGRIEDFARNAGDKSGPASKLGNRGLERPVAVRFDPSGTALYVVDFGVVRMTDDSSEPQQGTGVLWRITREASHAATTSKH